MLRIPSSRFRLRHRCVAAFAVPGWTSCLGHQDTVGPRACPRGLVLRGSPACWGVLAWRQVTWGGRPAERTVSPQASARGWHSRREEAGPRAGLRDRGSRGPPGARPACGSRYRTAGWLTMQAAAPRRLALGGSRGGCLGPPCRLLGERRWGQSVCKRQAPGGHSPSSFQR